MATNLFETIPDELLLTILDRVDPVTHWMLKSVDRRFRGIIINEIRIRRYFPDRRIPYGDGKFTEELTHAEILNGVYMKHGSRTYWVALLCAYYGHTELVQRFVHLDNYLVYKVLRKPTEYPFVSYTHTLYPKMGYFAAYGGQIECYEMLKDLEADHDNHEKELAYAIRGGQLNFIAKFHGPKVPSLNLVLGELPLNTICRYDQLEILQWALRNHMIKFPMGQIRWNRKTIDAINTCIRSGGARCLEHIFTKGFPVGGVPTYDLNYAEYAYRHDNLEALKFFYKQGYNLNLESILRKVLIPSNFYMECLQYLISIGACIDTPAFIGTIKDPIGFKYMCENHYTPEIDEMQVLESCSTLAQVKIMLDAGFPRFREKTGREVIIFISLNNDSMKWINLFREYDFPWHPDIWTTVCGEGHYDALLELLDAGCPVGDFYIRGGYLTGRRGTYKTWNKCLDLTLENGGSYFKPGESLQCFGSIPYQGTEEFKLWKRLKAAINKQKKGKNET